MRIPNDEALARLEAKVAANPESEEAHAELLEALCADARYLADPRRFDQIAWFLDHNPRHINCTTPFFHVDPQATPEVFARLKERWLKLLNDEPDSHVARGAAAFVAAESLDDAKRILRAAYRQRTRRSERRRHRVLVGMAWLNAGDRASGAGAAARVGGRHTEHGP